MSHLFNKTWILPSFVVFCANRLFSSSRLVTGLTSRNSYTIRRNPLPRLDLTKMTMSTTCSSNNELASVADFVSSVKQRLLVDTDSSPTSPRLIIGNEAGDADSILSAIGLSYVKALQRAGDDNDGDSKELVVPIVSIPADSLKSLRPETTYLLADCAGMDNVKADVNDLIAIDQTELLPRQATLTLADHNVFRPKKGFDWVVTEIVDHHFDEGKHMDTCPTSKRNIAFEDSLALVASTTTLVAEEFYASTGTSKMPPTLTILLLGTILLDSVNMNPKAGKGTPRDAAAIQRLLEETDWSQITLPGEILAIDDSGNKGCAPDPTKLFEKLQNAKFSPEFWNGLTAEQAIRLDFKSFSIPKSSLGLGSVLLEMDDFFEMHGDHLPETLARLIEEDQSELLGLMFCTFGAGDKRRRQIALASYDKSTLDELIEYLAVGTNTTPDLEINEVNMAEKNIAGNNRGALHVVRIEQGNVAASRKQVAPILMDFFNNQ